MKLGNWNRVSGGGGGSVAYCGDGKHVVVGQSDGRVEKWELERIRRGRGGGPPPPLHEHDGRVVSVAGHPQMCASAAADPYAYVYPDDGAPRPLAAFTLPLRAVAVSPSGALVAAAGDDGVVRVLHRSSTDPPAVLRGRGASLRALAFDPREELLATLSVRGELCIWNLSSMTLSTQSPTSPLHGQPNSTSASSASTKMTEWGELVSVVMSWSADGASIAVPSGHTVAVLDRQARREPVHWPEEHSAAVFAAVYSPSGQSLLSADTDGRLLWWDSASRQSLASLRVESGVSSVTWVSETELLVMDAEGRLASLSLASEPAVAPETPVDPILGRQLDEILGNPSSTPQRPGLRAHTGKKVTLPSRRRLAAYDADDHLDDEDDDGKVDSERASHLPESIASNEESSSELEDSHRPPKRTPSIQPPTNSSTISGRIGSWKAFRNGETDEYDGRRMLSWSLAGYVLARHDVTGSVLDVDMYEKGVASFRFGNGSGFDRAALGRKALLLANSRDGLLHFRLHETWSSTREWSLRLEDGESAEALAVCGSHACVLTSSRALLIYSFSGLVRHVLSVCGLPLALAACDSSERLAFLSAAPSGGSCSVSVLCLRTDRFVFQDLPVPFGEDGVRWIGFRTATAAEEDGGQLGVQDARGRLHVLVRTLGAWTWLPVLDVPPEEDWRLVGFTRDSACGVPHLRSLSPVPLWADRRLRVPAAGLTEGDEGWLRNSRAFATAVYERDAGALPLDEFGLSRLDETAAKAVAALDAPLLRAFHEALRADRAARALDLCARMALPRSRDLARELAERAAMPALVARIDVLRGWREELPSRLVEPPRTLSLEDSQEYAPLSLPRKRDRDPVGLEDEPLPDLPSFSAPLRTPLPAKIVPSNISSSNLPSKAADLLAQLSRH